MVYFIGDVHGKTAEYTELASQLDAPSIQLGDMGIGFKSVKPASLASKHRFIHGNHDDPDECAKVPNFLGRYGYIEPLFFISGGYSIDWKHRIMGVSWWEKEQLSYLELQDAIDVYTRVKPELVISHDAPTSAARHLLSPFLLSDREGYHSAKADGIGKSRTSQAMEIMLEIHRPKQWVFGHFHTDAEFDLDGTHFTALGELSVKKFDYVVGEAVAHCAALV